jgi:hypothetical protein
MVQMGENIERSATRTRESYTHSVLGNPLVVSTRPETVVSSAARRIRPNACGRSREHTKKKTAYIIRDQFETRTNIVRKRDRRPAPALRLVAWARCFGPALRLAPSARRFASSLRLVASPRRFASSLRLVAWARLFGFGPSARCFGSPLRLGALAPRSGQNGRPSAGLVAIGNLRVGTSIICRYGRRADRRGTALARRLTCPGGSRPNRPLIIRLKGTCPRWRPLSGRLTGHDRCHGHRTVISQVAELAADSTLQWATHSRLPPSRPFGGRLEGARCHDH